MIEPRRKISTGVISRTFFDEPPAKMMSISHARRSLSWFEPSLGIGRLHRIWCNKADAYLGLAIEHSTNAAVVIDSDSLIIKADIAEAHRPAPPQAAAPPVAGAPAGPGGSPPPAGPADGAPDTPPVERKPTRFIGTVMISAERPARDIHQIVEAIVEQLTTIPGSEVSLKLEIDAEVPAGLDRAKVRTLIENANTLGFLDKEIR